MIRFERCGSYGTLCMMPVKLSPTSYLVLGLVRMLGEATPYDLKHAVARSVGNMWAFPHTQLYTEPARLAEAGLLEEEREDSGRRRRTFRMTAAGRTAFETWLADPDDVGPTEIRDVGLLQLFFSGFADPGDVARLAARKVALHEAKLAGYEQVARMLDAGGGELLGANPGDDPRWRRRTLEMGMRFERLAAEFWRDVRADADADT